VIGYEAMFCRGWLGVWNGAREIRDKVPHFSRARAHVTHFWAQQAQHLSLFCILLKFNIIRKYDFL